MIDTFSFQAIDPGDRHCGVAKFRVLAPTDARNRSGGWLANCEFATEVDPAGLVAMMEQQSQPVDQAFQLLQADRIDFYVIEEFRLYPWMAREQGYSDFKTPRLIGKLEYLAQRAGKPVYLQGASCKKPAVARAQRLAQDSPGPGAPELVRLSSGRYDFKGKNQHVRDAIAHGWYWLLTNPDSPLADT